MRQQEIQVHSEVEHEMTLFAKPIVYLDDFPITNSLLSSVITVIILVTFFVVAGKRIARVPKGLQNLFEIILESALNFADTVTGSRKKSERFMPIVLGLFLFILVNNYLGILPGFGTIGFVENHEGRNIFVPFLRGGSADLNNTLALAIVTMLATHLFGITSIGMWKHLNKFINFKAIYEIPSKFRKDKTVLFVNPIKVFVCLIEIVSEIAKVVSLSFRLFGNMFAGEVLIATMMTLSAFLLPIPFLFLEVLVCAVQALVFAILILVFMSMATTAEEY